MSDLSLVTLSSSSHYPVGLKCPRHRIPRQHYSLFGLAVLMVSTVSLSGFSIYLTGRTNIPLIKRIIFAATALMTMETVGMMLVARQALTEALIAGIFPLTTGFMLLLHVDDLL
jgi:hypothetical protein